MDQKAGATIYTCMLNKNAGIEADLTVSVVESGNGGPADPTFQVRILTEIYQKRKRLLKNIDFYHRIMK